VLVPIIIVLAIALAIGLTLLAVSRRGEKAPTPFAADDETPLWTTDQHSDALETEGTAVPAAASPRR
jgi:hypothetical protein